VSSGCTAAAEDVQRHLLAEPIDYTSVLDAFEADKLLDVSVGVSFRRRQQHSTIARERIGMSDTIGGRTLPVVQSREVTTSLSLDLAVGVWHDLMVYGRLPLVLSDTRSLRQADGVSTEAVNRALLGGEGDGNAALFDRTFTSATRSGIPALEFGVAWGVFNQYVTDYLPTWVLSLETRIGIGKLQAPCADGAGCNAGINRGTAIVALQSRWSYRWRFLEPYLGLKYADEIATAASENFNPHGAVPSELNPAPPSVYELTAGMSLIAWEDRRRFQRLWIDVRGYAAYVSAGRDDSPLYDALGTSSNPQLHVAYQTASGSVTENGLTNVASYARLRAEITLGTQAARYVRFRAGIGLSHVTSHLLTDAAACIASGDGSCPADRVNPLYRPVIDLPGQRFIQTGELTFDVFADATGEF
jgi:hypothetical protein